MKRRDFFTQAASLSAGTIMLSPGSLLAQAKSPQEGKDFTKLDKPVPVQTPVGRVEVIEFFWYSCPHCNAFEPILSQWVKQLPKDVMFKRVPVAFRDDFVPQQRLFYALEAVGLLDKLHAQVFDAIHAKKQNLSTDEAIIEWVLKQGLEKTAFLAKFNSFDNYNKASQAKQLQSLYQVEGVPAMGVAGRFYTDGSQAGSMERVLQVVDFLTEEVRRQSGSVAPPSPVAPVKKAAAKKV